MATDTLGFFSRLFLGLLLPFRLLVDGQLAARIARLQQEPAGALPAPATSPGGERVAELEAEVAALRKQAEAAPAKAEAPSKAQERPSEAAALQVLAILQRDGRLVDFLTEDVKGFSDAEVGAAARLVHDGCKKVMTQYFTVEPVRKEDEGAKVTVDKGFDANEIRLTGNVAGEPPYKGTLAHPGWRVTQVNLPEPASGVDLRVIAPAEVEL